MKSSKKRASNQSLTSKVSVLTGIAIGTGSIAYANFGLHVDLSKGFVQPNTPVGVLFWATFALISIFMVVVPLAFKQQRG